jgi:chemotaxis protein methyltransferase CheR
LIHDFFNEFRDLIEERCGIHFDESQRPSLSASLASRMQQLGLADAREYYDRLRGQTPSIEVEFRHLINLVTVTETSFFRDPSQFLLLRHHIVPTLLAERAAGPDLPRTIRIWSAGCSSGEEAYSIAITLSEMGVSFAYPDWSFEIVGTDLNTKVLEAARRGVYSSRAVRNVEGGLLARYFRPEGNTFALSDEIKRRVRFEEGNLTQFPLRCPQGELQDIVFCKNVAIYFRPDATRQLVRGLRDAITGGGYLLVGHSESLWQMSDGFSLVEHNRAYCYRKDRRSSIVDRPSSIVDGRSSSVDRSVSAVPAIDHRRLTVADGQSPAPDAGQSAMVPGRSTMDDGRWTIDDGRWTISNTHALSRLSGPVTGRPPKRPSAA